MLQQILFFRELGFERKQIKEFLSRGTAWICSGLHFGIEPGRCRDVFERE
jgi:hypothetical protein